MAAAVEDPLAQIPGGDCNNQNCTAEENNCGALGHHLRGGQKCVQPVHLLWLTQSQNCSAAPRQLGALKYGAQLPTIVALVYCNCWPMVSMSGPWTSYLGFSIERWLFKKSWHLVFGRTVKYESEGHDLVICKSPVTRNVIWNRATSRHLSTKGPRIVSWAPSHCVVTN